MTKSVDREDLVQPKYLEWIEMGKSVGHHKVTEVVQLDGEENLYYHGSSRKRTRWEWTISQKKRTGFVWDAVECRATTWEVKRSRLKICKPTNVNWLVEVKSETGKTEIVKGKELRNKQDKERTLWK